MAKLKPIPSEDTKSKIENHPAVVYLSIAVAAAVAGFGAAWWLATNVVVASKETDLRQLKTESETEIRQLKAELASAWSTRTNRSFSWAMPSSLASTNGTNQGPKPPISIELLASVFVTNSAVALADLRKARGLRELTALESGKRNSTVPKGTYFYCYPNHLEKKLLSTSNDYSVNRFKPDRLSYYEVHRLGSGDDLIVGFTSSSEAASVSHLDGDKTRGLVLFADPTKDQTSLVSIPVDRIESCMRRDVELDTADRITVLDMEVR